MFIKSLKIAKKQNKLEAFTNDQNIKISSSNLKGCNIYNPQTLSDRRKSSWLKLKLDKFQDKGFNNNSTKKSKIIKFQNEYLQSLTNKESILDERRQSIKQKIKDKVKQQLADLLKRNEFAYSSLRQIKQKDDIISQSRVNVLVQGSSIKKSIKTSPNHKTHQTQSKTFRRFTQRKLLTKKSFVYQKPFTADSENGTNKKQRRSLSNAIKLHQFQTRRTSRHIHSALGQLRKSRQKDSVQIEPWQYTEEF